MTKRFSKRDVLKGAGALGLSAFAVRVAAAAAAEAMTPALIEAATKEGKLAFYTAMDLQFAERLAKACEARFPGIVVRVERSGAERVFTRIGQEYSSNIHAVDVANTADQAYCIIWKRNGWLAPYLPEEVAQHFDKRYYDPEGLNITTRILVSPIAYNTNLVKKEDAPKSFKDLLDPKWVGKLVKAHPAYSGTIMNATFEVARDLGWDYFEKLAKQKVMQVQSATDTPKRISLGERAVMVDGAGYLVIRYKEAGQPVDIIYPEDRHAARHRSKLGLEGCAQSERGASVPELDALARGPATSRRLGPPVFAAWPDRGKARHPQARRHQADEGGSGRRLCAGGRGQEALRRDF
jgi:iron(III) transport system substrate-binding protein